MTNKTYLNWEEFHQDVKQLCQKIKASGNYNKIVAISRGGLVPAGILAYELNIRSTEVINVATYIDDVHLKLEKIDKPENVGEVNEQTLIVDDLVDSGQTFEVLRQTFPKAKYVSVYTKNKSKDNADIFARELPDEWIVFPWDI